jgi:hypothetical protein
MKNTTKISALVIIVLITVAIITASKERSEFKNTNAEQVENDLNYEGIALQDKDTW